MWRIFESKRINNKVDKGAKKVIDLASWRQIYERLQVGSYLFFLCMVPRFCDEILKIGETV